jgi:hypothetical protein
MNVDMILITLLTALAGACLFIAIYHRLEVLDARESLASARDENTRLKRERAIIRPLTQAEFAALAKRHCGTCSGSGVDAGKRKHCDCMKAKLDARIESGDVTMRDGRPWIVERLAA